MKVKFSAHGCYRHQYHIVWIPKYRKRVLVKDIKGYLEKKIYGIMEFHPEVHVEQMNIQPDHIHLIVEIPPKYSVSKILCEIKTNTSREIFRMFPWIKKEYWKQEFWSPGFFSSTIGLNEREIQRYVEFQEQIDKGAYQLRLDL